MNAGSHHITLERLRTGDEVAFKKIYEDNRQKFLNFCRSYTLTEAEIVDIYQDAYIIFYNKVIDGTLTTFSSSISTYIFGIGKNLILKKLANNKTLVRSDYILEVATKQDDDFAEIEIEEDFLSPQQILLKKHFRGLGKQCQKILTLFYYRGLSIKEIIEAGRYNNANVVKSQKSRCLKSLRERIKQNPRVV